VRGNNRNMIYLYVYFRRYIIVLIKASKSVIITAVAYIIYYAHIIGRASGSKQNKFSPSSLTEIKFKFARIVLS